MPTGDRPISSVLSDIVGNLQRMVRAEFRLAKSEVTEELGKARSAGLWLGAGAVMLILSVAFALLAAVYALTLVLPAWAAALIVAAATGLIAAGCVGFGISKFKATHAIPKTTASLEENVAWAKQLTR
jgi:hypothetical protein